MLGHRQPAGPDVVGVLAGEYQDPSFFDGEIPDWSAFGNVQREQEGDCSLAGSGRCGERIDEAALNQAVDEVVGRDEAGDEFLAADEWIGRCVAGPAVRLGLAGL